MRIRFLLIPCLMMSILTFIFESVPQYDQEIVLTGKYNAVVVYDVHGIPTISGDTYLDVMYGLGYVHAQDRLWQLHYRRMLAQGKMASILGDEWFEMDKYLRNAGYLESARRIVQKMDSRTRELLQTYADGINYGVSKLTKLPIEFDLIDAEFQPWTILDTVAFIKYFNLLTSNELYSELMKQQVSAVYSKNITAILTGIGHLRQYHPEQSIISDLELKAVGDLYQEYKEYKEYKEYSTQEEQYNPEDDFKVNGDAQIFEINPEMGGSNSWVVSGKLTDTGFPILANDPHLENLMPSQWYLVNLVMKDNFIKGGSMPGTPTIPVGRSKKFSWGSTILYFDNVDLYEEKLKKVDGKLYYLFKDEWLPCTEFQEEIDNLGVKQTFTFYKTQHGPIMEYFYDRKSHQIVRFQGNFSLKATVYDDDYCFYMTLLDFQLGDDFKKGLEGFKCVTTLNQGMVFASEKDIGFVPVGKQIIRTGNPDSWGIPKQGWTGEVEWVRFLTPEEHPIIINPEKGYIISSNQRLFTRNVKYYLSHGVYSGPRPHRIDVVLRSAKNFSVQDTMNLQNDLVDQYPKETIQVLFQYLDWNNTKHKQFMDIIGQWDFRYSLESTEATLFAIFELYYIDTFMYLTQGWKKGYDFDSFFFKNILEFSYNQPWCNNTKNSATPCLDNLRNSVDKAIDKYEKLSDKTWKTHHTQFFPHTAFENEFDGEFNRQIPHVGFRRCVQNSKTELVLGSSLGVGGPNMRAVISMKPGDQAYFMIDTGQSGNPLSEHYDDLMQKWNRDEYVTIGTSSIDIE